MTSLKNEIAEQAFKNATQQVSTLNYNAIFNGFMEKGIDPAEILPRENIFTYNAWRALNRQVRKGETGVKVLTFVNSKHQDKKTGEEKSSKFQRTTTVFHITQTDPIKADNEPTQDEKETAEIVQPLTEPATAPAPITAKKPNDAFEIGEILYTSWGYDQTNIDFYQVVGKKGKSTVEIQGIQQDRDYDSRGMTGEATPKPDFFHGEKIACRLGSTGYLKLKVAGILFVADFSMVDGKKVYKSRSFSSYA